MNRNEKVDYIKSVIEEWGGITTCDLELEASPVYNSFNKDSYQLIERFTFEGVGVVSYIHETEVDWFYVDYVDLRDELLDEVVQIMMSYDLSNHKAERDKH